MLFIYAVIHEMGRMYQSKTTRQSWNTESMAKVLQAVRTREKQTLKASKSFGVPRTTLQRLAV